MRNLARSCFALAPAAVLAGALALSGAPASAGAAARFPTVAAAHAAAQPQPAIQHVIVVIQSGHSFDNYFGTRRGVDGIPAAACQRVQVNSKACVKPYHLNSDQARAGLTDTLKVTTKAMDAGRMDGFVSAQPNASIGSLAMGHLNGSDLPYYWNLADRFTLYDHFFAASQAGPLPNRLSAVAGQTDGIQNNTPPLFGIEVPTVLDQLNAAHLSWKYYVQSYPFQSVSTGDRSRVPLLSMPAIVDTPANASRIVNSSQYFTDLADGHLPAVSYVISSSGSSERAPQSPAQGEAFVESLVNALMQSSSWSHTALLLTYDDSGGWYDHAVPPTVGGVTWGIRVPTILVSPYARAGYVDHTQADTASIPGFVDQVFHLPPLNAQVTASGDLTSGLDLHQQPIPAAIPSHVVLVKGHPSVSVIYALYLLALIGAGLVIFLAFRRARFEPATAGATTEDVASGHAAPDADAHDDPAPGPEAPGPEAPGPEASGPEVVSGVPA